MTHPEHDLVQAERRRLGAAFDHVLNEPVPDRLRALLAPPVAPTAPPASVVDLAAARTRRRAGPTWAAWGGMAATLVLGTLLGLQLAPRSTPSSAGAGALVATGDVAQALEHQLASDAPGPVAVQLSFRDHGGRYCRSFTTATAAGLACRETTGHWALQQVASLQEPATPDGHLRQATSSLPPALLAAIDTQAVGEPLNAAQERAARDAGWRR